MANNMKTKKLFYTCLLLGGLACFACSKMDDYKKYAAGGELVYPTKIGSLKILPGKNRVAVSGIVAVNRGMSSFRVYWNNRKDSVTVPVTLTEEIDTIEYVIPDLPEGPMNFEVRSFDAQGNSSVPLFVVGNVYGERFREGTFQRSVLSSAFNEAGEFIINFQDVSKDMGFYGVRLKYVNADNEAVDSVVVVPNVEATVVLDDYVIGSTIDYATIFRPEPNAIDTFTYAYESFHGAGDVSELYLTNYKRPFDRSEFDGSRWGTLADWVTNDAMKHRDASSGRVGGYATDNGGTVKFEIGYGGAEIINGKVYQTVSLPAGRYRFTTNVAEQNWGDHVPVFLVANEGEQLPDYDAVESDASLGSARLTSGVVSFEFEVEEPSAVSLGFVVNEPNTDWRYLNLEYFKLDIL